MFGLLSGADSVSLVNIFDFVIEEKFYPLLNLFLESADARDVAVVLEVDALEELLLFEQHRGTQESERVAGDAHDEAQRKEQSRFLLVEVRLELEAWRRVNQQSAFVVQIQSASEIVCLHCSALRSP